MARLTQSDLPPEFLNRKTRSGKTVAEELAEKTKDLSPAVAKPEQQKARGRKPAGPKMNMLETRYSQELDRRKYTRQIIDWRYEPFNLRLAWPKLFYKIDFLVINAALEVELHETKGDWTDADSLGKFKMAAKEFPWFIFKWVKFIDGAWVTRTLRDGVWIDDPKIDR